jgi:FMN phosphatase YigB (HAD superfamily)
MKAFLFDLDGTLLLSDEEIFYNRYFELVGQEFKDVVNPKALIDAIQEIIENMIFDGGDENNYQRFMEKISQKFGKKALEFEKRFDVFYSNNFRLLKPLTKPNDRLINHMRALSGVKVLATNPIFPEIAIKERMKWAGLDDDDFALVTFMENSHYLKPNPKYFLEICEKIKVDPQNCTMMGNDPKLDGACEKVGIKFVLVGEDGRF